MSSVTDARISGEFATNRNPAERLAHVTGSTSFEAIGRGRSDAIRKQTTTPHAVSARKTGTVPPRAKIASPPKAGPTSAAVCHAPDRHVTALAKSRGGTSAGSKEWRAGNEKALATPTAPSSA